MNPEKWQLEIIRGIRAAEDRAREESRDRLHRAAVARRRKAKRGGRR